MDGVNAFDKPASNARPYVIFYTYLSVCLAVTIFIVSRLLKKHESLLALAPSKLPPKRHLRTFAGLAALSLLSTWGFMFRYFQWSYENWSAVRAPRDLDPSMKHWGLWLKYTSLFKEAWESVIVGHTRYWWSHQIFFFACALGLHLEWKGIRRGIKYTWAFMLLGQIVAISFATNLFLLTLLLSAPQQTSSAAATHRKWLGPWLLDLFAVLSTVASASYLAKEEYWNHPRAFMPLLLAPHISLLILPAARAILPANVFRAVDGNAIDKIYRSMWLLVFGTGILQLFQVTDGSYTAAGFQGIFDALFEHPAVSSVGFDVIFCWITWLCWWQMQGQSDNISAQPPSYSKRE